MEWERKFYEIVQETESNLAKARQKLNGQHGNVVESRSHEIYGVKPGRKSSAHCSSLGQFLQKKDDINTARRQLGLHKPVAKECTPLISPTHQDEQMRKMLQKLDEQNLEIQKLETLVKKLDGEREHYRSQLRELKSEVGNITSTLGNKYSTDQGMESQVQQMRQDLMTEIHRLQNMFSAKQLAGSNSSAMEKSIAKDLKDIKDTISSDMESLHRDLGQISRRVGKLELDLSTQSTVREVMNEQREKSLLNSTQTSLLSSTTSRLERSLPHSPSDYLQMQQIRLTLASLHDKLDSLEQRLSASTPAKAPLPFLSFGNESIKAVQEYNYSGKKDSPKPYKPLNKSFLKHSTKHTGSKSFLDELDLSDDLDLTDDLDDDSLSDELNDLIREKKKSSPFLSQRKKQDDNFNKRGETFTAKPVFDDLFTSNNTDDLDLELDNLDLSDSNELDSLDDSNEMLNKEDYC